MALHPIPEAADDLIDGAQNLPRLPTREDRARYDAYSLHLAPLDRLREANL